MITENQLVVSGCVCQKPVKQVSPSGISHCQFVIEHRSMQKEAGFYRQAWCWLPIVISGNLNLDVTYLSIGVQVVVKGFISCHKRRNGFHKIVLHAATIDLAN